MEKIFSVIIPTFNRAEILLKTLDSLRKQTFPKDQFEVIIVDDGSTDDTAIRIQKYIQDHKSLNLKYFKQKNAGQGLARNLGISKSSGKIIVFIGDDIIMDEVFLSEHWKTHQEHKSGNAAVLGKIEWHKDLQISPFMSWLTNGSSVFGKFGGHQFAFEKLEGKKEADFNFFYTSNISLKREMLEDKDDQFDPNFGAYGWEDIELGYRLHKQYGLKIFYNPKAIGYHYHYLDEKSLKNRMFAIGKSPPIIDAKHPELKKVPGLWKKTIFVILGSLPSLVLIWLANKMLKNKFIAFWYYALSKRYFIKGVRRGSCPKTTASNICPE